MPSRPAMQSPPLMVRNSADARCASTKLRPSRIVAAAAVAVAATAAAAAVVTVTAVAAAAMAAAVAADHAGKPQRREQSRWSEPASTLEFGGRATCPSLYLVLLFAPEGYIIQ